MSSLRLEDERLGQLEQVLLRDGQRRDAVLEVRRRADVVEHGPHRGVLGPCAHRGPTRGTATRMFSATVMSGSTAGCWWTIAMPSWVAIAGVSPSDSSAVHRDRAGVGNGRPGRHAHQGRLAGTVLAEQRVHLAGQDLERHVGQRGDAVIVLADPDRTIVGSATATAVSSVTLVTPCRAVCPSGVVGAPVGSAGGRPDRCTCPTVPT